MKTNYKNEKMRKRGGRDWRKEKNEMIKKEGWIGKIKGRRKWMKRKILDKMIRTQRKNKGNKGKQQRRKRENKEMNGRKGKEKIER